MADTYWGLEVRDWFMCAAVVLGPILAVQVQKIVERIGEKSERRVKIFKTLMTTRAERVSLNHVQALNMIDIEFYGRMFIGHFRWQSESEKAVMGQWKQYRAHLNDRDYQKNDPDGWYRKTDDLFMNLLFDMSKALGYDFDKVQLKSDAYRPIAHENLEKAQLKVLNGWADLLDNKQSLQIELTNLPPNTEATDTN